MPRLLLIDDDDLVRAVLATALTRAGHAVVQAGDGRQGVRLFAAEPADLVITDLVMPDREGLEVITELRRGWPEVPIIAMSGGLPRSDFYLDMAGRLGAPLTRCAP